MPDSNVSTKEQIISMAIELFAEKGYFETSMKDIATLVGIKAASIYNHFESKEAVLNIILDEYFEVIKENSVPVEEIAQLIGVLDTKAILNKMFFLFRPETDKRHTKILKVIVQEQFREKRAKAFVRDVMFTHNEAYVKEVLDTLLRAGKIRPIDTRIYAKILISLTISSSNEMMFYGIEEYKRMDRVSRREATDYLFDMIIL